MPAHVVGFLYILCLNMTEALDRPIPENQFNVYAWNILFDKKHGDQVPSQAKRLASLAQTLIELEKPLDIVAIIEAEETVEQHNGEMLAKLTGHSIGQWEHHGRERELTGMFGAIVGDVEFLELGHGKTAAITYFLDIAIAAIHLQRRGAEKRCNEIGTLLEYMEGKERAVIMGDMNCLRRQKPRKMIEDQDYESVFRRPHRHRPRTVPTKAYRNILTPKERLAVAVSGGLFVDDIYVKGLEVVDADIFVGKTDHAGVRATLQG